MPEQTAGAASSTPKAAPKTTTLDNPLSQQNAAHESLGTDDASGSVPRYIPSQINDPVYAKTQIRRLETYQRVTIVSVLRQIGIDSYEAVEDAAKDPQKANTLAHYLQTCLVGEKHGNGPAHLFRKGKRGLDKLQEELNPTQIAKALRLALEQVQAFG